MKVDWPGDEQQLSI